MITQKIRLGFIGAGFVNQQCHLPCFSAVDRFDITCIADPISDLRNEIARKYSIPHQFESHIELIRSNLVDAVVVTLPRFLTYHVVKDCIDNGLWTFAEKPLCLNSKYAEELISACETNKVSIMTGYMRQHDSGVKAFKNILDKIDCNDIVSINAYSHMGHSYAEPFGDIKGVLKSSVTNKRQSLPDWLPIENYFDSSNS